MKKFKIKDYNDVMDLSANITYELQDLKLIKSAPDNYNFDVEKHENNEYSKDDITKFLAELKQQELTKGKVVHIKPGCIHRIEALEDLTIIESSSVELDDVIRMEDDTGRPNGRIESEHST